MGRRWEGYRKVRKRVGRKIMRRAVELGYSSLKEYQDFLVADRDEWARLDPLLDVTISRFYRDRAVFDFIDREVVPALLRSAASSGCSEVRAWSVGCANGEEPYTLALMWEFADKPAGAPDLRILATDVKPSVLLRAKAARYPGSSVRDLPTQWREAAFDQVDDALLLAPRYRNRVTFVEHDIRDDPPDGHFDLVLCRYQAFTYFDDAGQRRTLDALAEVTRPGSVLVLGSREKLPSGVANFRPLEERLGVFVRCG
jgi:chemotaxis protein methyltransferase CheR